MDPAYAAVHAEEDRAHWWFLGRRAVILAEMTRRLPARGVRLAELGCGSGGMLEALGRFGTAVGVEMYPALRARARERGLDVRAGALPDAIPLEPGRWDAVCLFDVLEHVDDEAGALAACRRLLAPGGRLFVTVPAYAWLWSRHDELLGHRRRYTARALRRAAERGGYTVERLTYFNTLLAPPIMAVRLARAALRRPGHDLDRPAPLLNRALAACFSSEARLLRWVSPPFGISILLAARLPDS
ncbi:MAG TPA: class I SAM-dependent methyltransferase [Methylomirabilota bacterium]|nr:class I SAM-dependent methyltransferase [Methylomirabilota bacterium]